MPIPRRPIVLGFVVLIIAVALFPLPITEASGATPQERGSTAGQGDRRAPAFLGPHFAEMRQIAETWFPTACTPTLWAADDPSRDAVAWAEAPARGHSRCAVTFNDPWFKSSVIEQCMAVIHEWGHLAGLDHSSDPRSIMYPSSSSSVPHACRALGRRAARDSVSRWLRLNKPTLLKRARQAARLCVRREVAGPRRCRAIVWVTREHISDARFYMSSPWTKVECEVLIYRPHGSDIRNPELSCKEDGIPFIGPEARRQRQQRSPDQQPSIEPAPSVPRPVTGGPVYYPAE